MFAHWVTTTPFGSDDPVRGFFFRLSSLYVRVVHRVTVRGRAHIAELPPGRPVLVIANHTAGVDPLLIQHALPFFVRWMMALDMRLPVMEWAWQLAEIISVDREGRDVNSARTALRHLAAGGVIGIFPEGALERPPRQVMPFEAGVGLLVKRSGAVVLPFIIEGTPQVDPAWASLWRASRSSVRIMPPIDYSGASLAAAEIAADLRARYAEWTGWPLNDHPPEEFPGGKGK